LKERGGLKDLKNPHDEKNDHQKGKGAEKPSKENRIAWRQ